MFDQWGRFMKLFMPLTEHLQALTWVSAWINCSQCWRGYCSVGHKPLRNRNKIQRHITEQWNMAHFINKDLMLLVLQSEYFNKVCLSIHGTDCMVSRSLSSMTMNFNYMCHCNFEKQQKANKYINISSNKFSTTGKKRQHIFCWCLAADIMSSPWKLHHHWQHWMDFS